MRFYLEFDVDETRALSTLAENEFRDIRTQAAVIIHDDLIRRGLLHAENETIQSPPKISQPAYKPVINEIEPLLKAVDVARILNVSRTQAYRLMQDGEIKSVKFRGSVRCTNASLKEFIETRGT